MPRLRWLLGGAVDGEWVVNLGFTAHGAWVLIWALRHTACAYYIKIFCLILN